MEFVAARSLPEVFDALDAEDARCLAGGQSLVAMMNLGLVAPSRLVSLRGVAELRRIAPLGDGGVRFGAMVTHEEVAAFDAKAAGPRLLAQAAAVVAYPAIRACGTIGGAVAHFDPAADYPVALVAAQATIEVASRRGVRRLGAQDFFVGMFQTALAPGEIVTAVEIPGGPAGARAHYEKLSLVAGDFAILSVAAIVSDRARVAIGGLGYVPSLCPAFAPTGAAALEAARAHCAAADPPGDHRASSDYRRKVAPRLVERAVAAAGGRT